VLVGFRSAYVFDVSQTDGEQLPELSSQVSGDVGERRERLIEFIAGQGIALEFKDSIAPALGMSYGNRIVLLPGQSAAEEFTTLVHELAHSMLHFAERRIVTTKTVRETEAEAIAFVVGTIMATPHFSQRVWRSSSALPLSSSPHSKPPQRKPPRSRTERI
jgi:hypothetical protein